MVILLQLVFLNRITFQSIMYSYGHLLLFKILLDITHVVLILSVLQFGVASILTSPQ